jgi:tRNA dimethylallyltransferase
MKSKPKVIVIVGPTTSGKSDYAVELAKICNGEVISADSRQVYQGLNIGAGKITKKEMGDIPHHLLDVANPKRVFTVSHYQKLTTKKIAEIIKRGHTPIVVGGTGFYIQAIVDGLILPEVKPDPRLRKELAKKSTEELAKILKKLDPARLKDIDTKNPVRLIRAIEIATAPKLKVKAPAYDFDMIGLSWPDEILKERIKTRLHKRLKQGLVSEVKKLHQNGLSWKRLKALGLEYRYVALFLQNKISKTEMIAILETEIWRYAKRQLTWFKKDKRINWKH